MKSTIKCSESKCGGIDTAEKMTTASQHGDVIETKSDRKDSNPKIKFVQCEDNDEQNQTPISCKLNKFMMCFKSEPDLSRVQNISENMPMLNHGRFIAKKLLSGVSMINLRRPFASNSEKATTTPTESAACKINGTIEKVDRVAENNVYETPPSERVRDECSAVDGPPANDKIDDDDEDFIDDEEVDREYDDSVDKENRTPFQSSTIGYMAKLKQQSMPRIGCSSIAVSDSKDSVSPITKSTHRMSKAMQVNELIGQNDLPLKYSC